MNRELRQIYVDLAEGRLSQQQALEKIRAAKLQNEQQTAGTFLAAPVWQSAAVNAAAVARYDERHVILCDLADVDAAVLAVRGACVSVQTDARKNAAERYSHAALACFARIRTILQAKAQGTVLVQIVAADALLAGLSALLKTAALENPRFAGQLVLVPAATDAATLAAWVDAEQASALEPVVRYDNGERQVLRRNEIAADRDTSPIAFREDGVYLITGGLGALGLLFAREIVARTTTARVVLTGRAESSAAIQARVAELSAQPGRVSYRRVNLEDAAEVEGLVAGIEERHGRLDGILHCAGMIADNFILRKTDEEFARVLAPKVLGTFHLDRATRDANLDWFVLFSSFAGAMGNVGQADYAAANGFMDQFASVRNEQVSAGERRGRTRSINWPLWQDGGMAIDAASYEQLQRATGLEPLPAETGLQLFHRSVALPHAQLLAGVGELARMRRAFLETEARVAAEVRQPVVRQAEARATVSVEQVQEYLCRELAGSLKLPVSAIDPEAALEQYGIDSILAMKLTSHLEKTFGVLSKTLFFEYQTITTLAGYFAERHADKLAALFEAPAAAEPVVEKTVETKRPARRVSRRRAEETPRPATEAEPIAIVGLSGRYPEAVDVEAYWQNLRDGKDCITEVPESRWNWREYFTEDRTKPGHHYSRWGGFIEGVDEFDPLFFNISPKEAKLIDPQERLFLQHAWKAIEDAGYTRAGLQLPAENDLAGQVGVYVGVMYSEYQLFGADAAARGERLGIAGSAASIANRVSYVLNLHGPSVTLDTMCSSSLTAIHFACQDLKLGRTSLAIAGGVNVTIHPNKYLFLSSGQFISGDGHCQSFGEGGDGYIPGEGVGAVVLKRLSDAQRDGDHIYGVIRGSALNHGGKTNGYTVPNPQAQATAIGRALADSKTEARHISYIEAHGTGTKLGDPIEIAALAKAFGTTETGFCLIGSAKSNVGHCESAAGMAGLTKVLLQMQHQEIVPSLHSAQLNPHIDFASSPFIVNQTLRPWERPVVEGRTLPRIAGISSFGAGGSNAHLIVEEYQAPVQHPVTIENAVIVLSARTPEQLQQKASELLGFVRPRVQSLDLPAVAWTLQTGREAMDERLAFTVQSAEELVEKLQACVAGNSNGVHRGQAKRNREVVSTDGDVAASWVRGANIDWTKLYDAQPQRVSLPTYPFARERYWVDLTPAVAANVPAPAATKAVLHPLLHANTSELNEQRYSSTFTEALPAASLLEMARAAVADATRNTRAFGLRDLAWGGPAAAGELHIALWANTAGEIEFEIYGNDEVIHCQGRAVPGAEDEIVVVETAPVVVETTPEVVVASEPEAVRPALTRREIVFATSAKPAERKKRAAVSLSAPGTASSTATTAAKAKITLSAPAAKTPALATASPVRLYDCENGIFSIELVASRAKDVVAHTLQALDRVQQEASLKVLLLSGIEYCFVAGDRDEYNDAVERKLFERLLSFPYPIVSVLPGDVVGAGFLAAALCDFMVCNEDAQYGYTEPQAGFYPAPAEAALFAERFGSVLAEDFLYLSTASTGRELRVKGWSCPIVPMGDVESRAEELVSGLVTKSQDALRLLKQHLTRHLVPFVSALQPVAAAQAEPAGEVLIVRDAADFAKLGDHKAVVLAGAVDVPRLDVPVVVALSGDAKNEAWLAALRCDAVVYSRTGVYSGAGLDPNAEAAALFTHRLGDVVGREVLLGGAEWRGAELAERAGALLVSDDAVTTAVRVAESWAKLPRTTLAAWKQQTAKTIEEKARTFAVEAADETLPATIAPFQSKAVTLTAHADGVVVVKLEDREARNMFSDDIVAGVTEAFAHIAANPACKVVVLTGYDNYFAAGGTKENLLAIQEGKASFTDVTIFQLPRQCRIPVVAAIQGHALGAGWAMGMFADFVVLSDESRYVSPYMNYGFTPGAGATWILADKIGKDLSRESLFTAQFYAGSALRERGLRLPILPRTEVVPAAMELARGIAHASRGRLVALKQQLTRNQQEVLADTYRRELAMHEQTFVGHQDTLAKIRLNFEGEIEQRPVASSVQPRAAAASAPAADTVLATIRTLLANELQMRESDIDEDAQFIDLGLDSISGVSWVRGINAKYETSIEATKVYSLPTLRQFAAYVKEECGAGEAQAIPPVQPVAQNDDVVATLRTLLANELQMRESDIDDDAQFIDLGLDSISGVSWIRRINECYQTSIEATKVYSFPTLRQLAQHVQEEAKLETPAVVEAPKPVAIVPVATKLTSRRAGRTAVVTAAAPARRAVEPIAIVGMAGQFPQAKNVDEFWQNIAEGKNCITRVDRWDLGTYYQPGDAVPGKSNCQWFGGIEDYDRFDPLFFNISPTEALSMDPQQRLFLQTCWHGIEDAGYDPRTLSGSKCGVFVGCASGEYPQLSRQHALSAQGFTGNAMSILAARISYFLNLQGPCISIDTACSSSLVAIANACDSLVSGTSDVALAGGVYVMAGPDMHIMTSQAAMLSPDGKCYTFDQRANGFVPGEGVGVVVLKRLSDAQRDGDVIHGVINGWGINQDGKTNGITAPNPESQTRLEQEVYDRFSIDPEQIGLVEAHGTGTKLGDPIEVEGLRNAFRKYTQKTSYCALGSVKSNIGHTLTAAGIAGVLKLVQALKHKQLPPTIHFEKLNEHIDLSGSPFFVSDKLQEWTSNGAPRQSAISSFGFSGTNVHLVIGEYETAATARPAIDAPVIVPLSARTAEQLEQKVRDLLAFVRTNTPSLNDLAWTLQTGRQPMDERAGFVAASVEQLAAKLEAWLAGERGDAHRGQAKRGKTSLAVLGHDEDLMKTVVEKCIAEKKLSTLAELWANGVELDWRRLAGNSAPRRISLPVYPFAKDRYWFDAPRAAATTAVAATAVLHPLVHRNTSDLSRQRFTSTFTGDEAFAIEKQLPAAACLEMARAAIERALPEGSDAPVIELRNTVWAEAIAIDGAKEVSIALAALEDEQIDFDIYSKDLVYCQGRAALSREAAPVRLDLEQLRANGETLVAIEAEALSSDFVVQPLVVERALQAALAGIDGAVPSSLTKLRILAPCTAQMMAWVRDASGAFDLDLCDASGNVCVELRGLAWQVLRSDIGSVVATPVWRDSAERGALDFAERHVFAETRQGANVAERYTETVVAYFERIQTILRSKPQGKVLVQIVVPDDGEQTLLAGLSGLLKTAALENPLIVGQLVLVPAQTTQPELSALLEEERSLEAFVRFRDGVRQVRRWQEVEAEATEPAISFKDGGVYLITGGRGALGTLFANEILARTRDARVILTGRSAAIIESNPRVSYRQVDLSDLADVKRLIAEVGPLDGILHSAGMIADNFIVRKTAAELRDVLAPKVTGTYNLDVATAGLELDFFVLFSSIAGALGNPGQADYAAANSFMDHFAAYRNALVANGERRGRTRSINWPLWQDGGMAIDETGRELVLQTIGAQPMQTATGLAAFHRSLALPYDELLVVEGIRPRIIAFLKQPRVFESRQKKSVVRKSEAVSVHQLQRDLKTMLAGVLQIDAAVIDADQPFAEYGLDSFLGAELIVAVNKKYGTELSHARLFDYSTVSEFARFLEQELAKVQPAAVVEEPVIVAEPVPVPVLRKSMVVRRPSEGVQPARDGRKSPSDEKIAIIGMSGRYPKASDLNQFWTNLTQGLNAITEVPSSRWDVKRFFDADRTKKDKTYSKWLGAVDDVDRFDPLFFRISPQEAEHIDPQQRLFLQEAYRAFEDAGYSTATLSNRKCGVYLGISTNEYLTLLSRAGVLSAPVTSNSFAIAAARIAYYLNLKGPAISVDTACSSSLVAIHLACQAILEGETDMALAGGVSLWLTPDSYVAMSKAGMFSPDGQCKTFDDGANGIVNGEGIGAVVLKRLSDAERDGDVIYGVILGSGINQDGRTNGITAPSVNSQIELERSIYAKYQIDPDTIGHVEAHGTGTKLGDPIELEALSTVFREKTTRRNFCSLGSVKSNIGHTTSAAGVAGLQKVLLSMRHRKLVPTLNVAKETSRFDFSNSPFYINRETRAWDVVPGTRRRAAVSSFGFSGTNAHLVVEEYVSNAPAGVPVLPQPVLVPLSARSPEQLRQRSRDLLDYLRAAQQPLDLAGIAWTLQVGREPMEERVAFVVGSVAQLEEKLEAFVNGQRGIEDVAQGRVEPGSDNLTLFGRDDDMQEAIEKWIARRKLATLADSWVRGLAFDWNKLWEGAAPRRVSLPTYPFAKERCWVEAPSAPVLEPIAADSGIDSIDDILSRLVDDSMEPADAVEALKLLV